MGALTLRVTGGQALKSFRLPDIPESIRLEAARKEAAVIARALKPGHQGRAGVSDEAVPTLAAAIIATRFALDPPGDRVFWVSQEAWDAMLERATVLASR